MSKPRRMKNQRGQGMTEYIIIVALVAIGAIAVVTIFGNNIRGLFGASASALAGQDTSETGAQTFDAENAKKHLDDFATDTAP